MGLEGDAAAFFEGLPLQKGAMQPRQYQLTAARNILEKGNALVVMPTALGKTFVALLVMAGVLKRNPCAKLLFLAPTKPLAAQQAQRIKATLELEGSVELLTGEMPAEERKAVYEKAQVVCATPQCVNNDVRKRGLDLFQYAFIAFDEVHRMAGDYAYVPIAEKARQNPAILLLGLTASPSSERARISGMRELLAVKWLEVKDESDEEVAGFVQDVEVDTVFVELPEEMKELSRVLRGLLSESISNLKGLGYEAVMKEPNKRQLLLLQSEMRRRIPSSYRALSELARAMNLMHGLDLLESQGISALLSFLDGLLTRKNPSKAVVRLSTDPRIAVLRGRCHSLIEKQEIEHPKIAVLKQIVGEAASTGKTLIVFVHFRDSAKKLLKELNSLPGVDARLLVGRSGDDGMKQKQQIGLLDSFRAKEFNVLVATSVAEEGLDVVSVDEVIFFEAVPSEVRLIQRRGRAGRIKAGKVTGIVAKGTKDEAFYWVSKRKEGKMKRLLKKMKDEIGVAAAQLESVVTAVAPASRGDAPVEKPLGKKEGQLKMDEFF
ncbi:TPA: DEAD/DEAH box helicase [Candidatus Micrarchaeota archaeon]|nr:DEAD/DEAH box helicase [Candidatus Micrarchaeota archaeon]